MECSGTKCLEGQYFFHTHCLVVLSLSDPFFDLHLIAKAPIAWKSFQKALENFPSYRRDLLLHRGTLPVLSVSLFLVQLDVRVSVSCLFQLTAAIGALPGQQ